jgi:glyoxylase-like metal-dependent hydrolase (beta-lactamase superfamily II)
MPRSKLLAAVCLSLCLGAPLARAAVAPAPAPAAAPTPRPPPVRAIVNITGDLYRAGNGNWWTAFLVTPAGIVLVDTINPDFAAWLKGELARRFPGKPVRYVIYSHSHWDHVEGGKVFEDTATFVGQEDMARNLDGRFPHMPGDMIDRNDDGAFQQAEITQPFADHPGVCGGGAQQFTSRDRNGDGKLTPTEFLADVRRPDILYSQRMTITLGGKTVELIHPGKNHADDGTAVLFPAERTLFSVDFPADALVTTTMRSLPSGCGPFDGHPLADWIASYRTLEALDFDILAQGHGQRLFAKQDLAEGREYFEHLTAAVSAAMAQGMSLEEMKRTITLDRYKDWAQFERLRAMDIEAAYENLKTYR